ncbi:hypothetical protein [Spirosoma oryzicola]|uniref:hypothetical protein n=1 Tax=Spirosoma oryzicola TaxID=2898794 RepID=UPI001E64B1F4|nr:hypothetical protein [Spirosoma oryzicola]UHG90920.1 hypothetical protein LQ777_22090 [Spirosoma oryzicola]
MQVRLLAFFLTTLLVQSTNLLAQSPTDSLKSRAAQNRDAYRALSRSPEDTTRSVFNFKAAPWYVRASPFLIYTGAGKPKDRIAQSIEVGKSFNVIDLGIAVGRNALRPDSTFFVEGRVTMDVANYGVFANEMTIGAGRVFDQQGSLMLELTYNIIAQIAPRFAIGLTTGYYDFSNETSDASKTFYGICVRYGLLRTDSGSLIRIGRPRLGRTGRSGHGRGR